ncbi:MAG: hypothetical protein KC592_05975 [Nitrospira sp.]|nr:hypothetical protein [Nitrospira sp.]
MPQAGDLSQFILPSRLQGKLSAAIPNWEDIAKVLELIGAENYSFTPEG